MTELQQLAETLKREVQRLQTMLNQQGQPKSGALPVWVSYDAPSDVLIIHGRRYSSEVFGYTGFLSPPGTFLRIEQSDADTVCVSRFLLGVSSSLEITREQHIALREAFAIGAADSYFEAWPTHDNDVGRMLFERGFARGFDSHGRAIETAAQGAKVAA